jgi:two-component system cell cycle sensor histidine kinase/response regulator CckA
MLVLDGLLAQSGSSFPALPWLDLGREKTGPAHPSVTVMVVDDNDEGRWITARMLHDEGYEVIEADSGEQALERLAQAREVQVIVTDIAMPGGIDGIELANRIMAATPWRRVVLMSGYARVFPQLGSSAVQFPLLVKPFSPDQLAQQIREVLQGDLN